MTKPTLTRQNTKKGHIGALFPSHSHEATDIETTGSICPKCPTINELHREAQEWRNRALLAESRLAILEAQKTTQEAHR